MIINDGEEEVLSFREYHKKHPLESIRRTQLQSHLWGPPQESCLWPYNGMHRTKSGVCFRVIPTTNRWDNGEYNKLLFISIFVQNANLVPQSLCMSDKQGAFCKYTITSTQTIYRVIMLIILIIINGTEGNHNHHHHKTMTDPVRTANNSHCTQFVISL